MKTTHTPGEWVAVKSSDGWSIKEKELVGKGYADVIAELYEYPENIEANARLLAAAPELLLALQKMCEYHERMATWDKGDNGYYFAKKVIKKATK